MMPKVVMLVKPTLFLCFIPTVSFQTRNNAIITAPPPLLLLFSLFFFLLSVGVNIINYCISQGMVYQGIEGKKKHFYMSVIYHITINIHINFFQKKKNNMSKRNVPPTHIHSLLIATFISDGINTTLLVPFIFFFSLFSQDLLLTTLFFYSPLYNSNLTF